MQEICRGDGKKGRMNFIINHPNTHAAKAGSRDNGTAFRFFANQNNKMGKLAGEAGRREEKILSSIIQIRLQPKRVQG